MQPLSLSKKLVFDRLEEVIKADKTSNSTPKCIWILERGELCSKSKCLAKQAFCLKLPPVRLEADHPPS